MESSVSASQNGEGPLDRLLGFRIKVDPETLIFTVLIVLASCTPQAVTTPIAAQIQTTTPTSTRTPKPEYGGLENLDGLKLKINEIISTKKATFGIGIYDFENQDTLFINEDKQFGLSRF